jgi:HEAT repeats
MGGKCFFMTARDRESKEWLLELIRRRDVCYRKQERPIPLVRFRGQFRRLSQLRPVSGLVSCLLEPDPDVRKVATWLLGRCRATRSASALCVLRSSRDAAIRRQVAIALKRMGECAELQWMAIRDPDARVRCIAGSQPPVNRRSYSDRLKTYVQHGGGELTRPGTFESRMALFISPSARQGNPAMTRQWIRRLLEHIRQLVRQPSRDHTA